MPAGRPKVKQGSRWKTTLQLDQEEHLAISRLRLHREAQGRPITIRDLVMEGISGLLAQEGLDPIPRPETQATAPVVEITKR